MLELLLLPALLFQDAKAADDAIERFKSAYKTRDASARAAAVAELGKTQDKKILSRLGKFLVVDVPMVRIAAAKSLSAWSGDKKRVVVYLLNGSRANAKDPTVLAAMLDALGGLGHPAAAREVNRHFKSRDLAIAKASVEAAGKIRVRESVQPLVKLLKFLEDGAKSVSRPGGGGGKLPGLGGGGNISDRNAQQRHRVVTPLVHKALRSITGEQISSRADWEIWYKVEGRTFKVQR